MVHLPPFLPCDAVVIFKMHFSHFIFRNVKVHSCEHSSRDRRQVHDVMTSYIVSDIVESLYKLCKLKMAPEFVNKIHR